MAQTYKSFWGEHDVRAGHVVVDMLLADRVRAAQDSGLTLLQIAAMARLTYSSFCNVLARIEHRNATTIKEKTWTKIDLALKTLGF